MPQFKKMRQTHYCINTFGHEKTNIKQMQIHGSLKTVLYIYIFNFKPSQRGINKKTVLEYLCRNYMCTTKSSVTQVCSLKPYFKYSFY